MDTKHIDLEKGISNAGFSADEAPQQGEKQNGQEQPANGVPGADAEDDVRVFVREDAAYGSFDDPEAPPDAQEGEDAPEEGDPERPPKNRPVPRKKPRIMVGKIPLIALLKISGLILCFLLIVFLIAHLISNSVRHRQIIIDHDISMQELFLSAGKNALDVRPLTEGAAVLTADHVHFLSTSGKLTDSVSHTFAQPVLRTAGRYSLLYDLGGKELRLIHKGRVIQTKEAPAPLTCAALNTKGSYVYLVNAYEGYQSHLFAYDKNDELLYEWQGTNFVLSAAISENSRHYAVSELIVSRGDHIGRVSCYASGSKEALYQLEFTDETVYDVFFLSNTLLCAVTDKGVYAIRSDGEQSRILSYTPQELNAYAHAPAGRNAFALNLYSNQRNVCVAMFDQSLHSKNEQNFENTLKSLCVNEKYTAAIFDHSIMIFDQRNHLTGSVTLDDAIIHAAMSGRTLFVQTKDGIARFDGTAEYVVSKKLG